MKYFGYGANKTAEMMSAITGKPIEQLKGVPVVLIDPRNTSRTCSSCGHCEKANRKNQTEFVCKKCGHCENADLNAAKNIRNLGLHQSAYSCPLSDCSKVA